MVKGNISVCRRTVSGTGGPAQGGQGADRSWLLRCPSGWGAHMAVLTARTHVVHLRGWRGALWLGSRKRSSTMVEDDFENQVEAWVCRSLPGMSGSLDFILVQQEVIEIFSLLFLLILVNT